MLVPERQRRCKRTGTIKGELVDVGGGVDQPLHRCGRRDRGSCGERVAMVIGLEVDPVRRDQREIVLLPVGVVVLPLRPLDDRAPCSGAHNRTPVVMARVVGRSRSAVVAEGERVPKLVA